MSATCNGYFFIKEEKKEEVIEMEGIWIWIIPLVGTIVIGLLAGRRQQFRQFVKELGEALIATDEYLAIDDPSKEDTNRFAKEWLDVARAGGNLFKKIVAQARKNR